MIRNAGLSDESPPRYRYWLTRRWDTDDMQARGRRIVFVMLNPSAADDTKDDPTVRACIKIARLWRCDSLVIVNLYALRSSKPKALYVLHDQGEDVIGPINDGTIFQTVNAGADIIIAAWGATPGPDPLRAAAVRELVGDRWSILGSTRDGSPRHPSPQAWAGQEYPAEPIPWPLEAAFAPPEPTSPLDVCECGHIYENHRGGICVAWVPALPLKAVDRDAQPIERVTQTIVATSARGVAHDHGSSVCPCRGFRPSGYRVVTPDDAEQARRVREGRARRTVLPIAEL